jgi:hypothetical protein
MDLSEMIKEAKKLQALPDLMSEKGIYISDFKNLQKFIEKEINEILFQRKLFSSSYFLCGSYISCLISETVKTPPESWYGIDYLIKNQEKKAGDIYFLICSLFTGRANRKLMKFQDYVDLGRSSYSSYYRKENKPIGYLMSVNYKDMAEITGQCFKNPF